MNRTLHNFSPDKNTVESLIRKDPYLKPYAGQIQHRISLIKNTEKMLTGNKKSLVDFASGHEYFGLHFTGDEWVFREWAPNATAIYLIGDISDWREKKSLALKKTDNDGKWELRLPPEALNHKDLYRLSIHWDKGKGDRMPAYARRIIQDPNSLIFNAQVWRPLIPYKWKHDDFRPSDGPLFVYEAHVGMAQETEKVGTYKEFSETILPYIADSGYNTIQLMAIPEHPYYGSFGYHVSSFFAASSRFGTPEDLKKLIDTAHGLGIMVIIDIVHSHSVSNEVEGLSRFDGTLYQYFHDNPRGLHNAWDSRCFDYGKHQVLHFLLSNCRFWLDEYHLDGFRFDGVTSMLYLHHGLEKAFTSYNDYFAGSVDEDALTYLALANKVIHDIKSDAITIAEDISGMPCLAIPLSEGGTGFDYRFAMGISDHWVKLVKHVTDENWPMGYLWYELNNRRKGEKTISYVESHDQALVGDQSLIFRLIGAQMYDNMRVDSDNIIIDRGIALHKMIRLITLCASGNGYLNFMGNEFGHPEWIDFPREGNNWSFRYARRQWSLAYDKNLRYHYLLNFDRDMISLATTFHVLKSSEPHLIVEHDMDKVIIFERSGLLFAFNFNPNCSFTDYAFETCPGKYQMIFNSDAKAYGGHNRLVENQHHLTIPYQNNHVEKHRISLYMPSRTAIVLKPVTIF